VARDQVAVLGGHEVGLDVVGAEFDAQRIRLQRVLGQIAAAAAAVAPITSGDGSLACERPSCA
jgi:hypothetical protein